ncbi:MAG TPA: permease-like cell division protein FtsX [Woeseiaceae bacterium]
MAVRETPENWTPVKGRRGPGVWLLRHVATAVGALGRLARAPFASLLTVLVIAVTLALPAALHLGIRNIQSLSGNWANALDFAVYLADGTPLADAERIADLLGKRADVETVTLIPAEQALAEFKATSGFGEALDALPANPLPHTLVVRPSAANTDASIVLLHEEIANLPEVELVQADTEWVRRFHAILDILERAVAIGSGLLAVAIVVIIGNTIRLDIQNRREEIEVTKLIGASAGFVRRPFLYTGVWYGLAGGIGALLLVAYGRYALEEPARRLAGLYDSSYSLLALGFAESAAIVGSGVLLGLAGSWLAAARHMRRIEPR